nr:T9SS type A sorting domain-containing protein [uncultured Draconibacterium sp.]
MKKIAIIIMIAGISMYANSQQMHFDWIAQAGGPGWDVVTDIEKLPNHKIVITGAFYDSIFFESDVLVSRGDRDIFISRYKANGSLDKAISLGGSGYDYAKKAALAGEKDLVVAIKFNDEIEIGANKYNGTFQNNCILAWFDESLKLTSKALISSVKEFDITSLKTASDGDLFFSGWFNDTLNVEDRMIIPESSTDVFWGKISPKGELKWLTVFGGKGLDTSGPLIVGTDQSVYLSGLTTNGCFGKKYSPKNTDENSTHLFISKLNENGEIKKVVFPISGYEIEPVDMVEDSSSVWLLANFKNTAHLKNVDLLSYGFKDVVLIKYNFTNGDINFCQLGGFGNEVASKLGKSGDELVITGLFNGKFSFAGKEVESKEFGTDVFIATVDSACLGKEIFSLTGEGNKFPCSAFVSDSSIYITGEFKNELNTGEDVLTSFGKEDIFIVSIENCNAKKPVKIVLTLLDTPDKEVWELDAGEGYKSYSWDDNISNSRYLTINELTPHSVVVTDDMGCTLKGKITFSILKDASIISNDITSDSEFRLYPTITSERVYWEPSTSWGKEKTNIRVFNSIGELVQSSEINQLDSHAYTIDFSREPEGNYLVEISGEGFREISKVIVKK